MHGRADLLALALAAANPGQPLVCVGDYVDRGPDTARVLDMLQARPETICLMGNHEEMLLDFLADPDRGRRWLAHGGDRTLDSYGITRPPAGADPTATAAALRNAMGSATLAWLAALPSVWQSGNVLISHAGADPGTPPEGQTGRSLRWGHPQFGRRRRRDGLWIVHGHTIVPVPRVRRSVVSLDTGAWATGRLTLARIDDTGVEFQQITLS